MRQKVSNPPIGALQGVAIVLGIMAAALLDALVFSLISPIVGDLIATIVFWAVGAGLALWVMRRYILSYSYVMNGTMLRVSYAYGRRERVMSDLYLNNLLACGTLEEMKQKYPGARVNRAALRRCPLPVFAVACRDNGTPAIFLLQPGEEIEAALKEALRARKKK